MYPKKTKYTDIVWLNTTYYVFNDNKHSQRLPIAFTSLKNDTSQTPKAGVNIILPNSDKTPIVAILTRKWQKKKKSYNAKTQEK